MVTHGSVLARCVAFVVDVVLSFFFTSFDPTPPSGFGTSTILRAGVYSVASHYFQCVVFCQIAACRVDLVNRSY